MNINLFMNLCFSFDTANVRAIGIRGLKYCSKYYIFCIRRHFSACKVQNQYLFGRHRDGNRVSIAIFACQSSLDMGGWRADLQIGFAFRHAYGSVQSDVVDLGRVRWIVERYISLFVGPCRIAIHFVLPRGASMKMHVPESGKHLPAPFQSVGKDVPVPASIVRCLVR